MKPQTLNQARFWFINLIASIILIGPLIGNGYWLYNDAVTIPKTYLNPITLGISQSPRAVPQDWLLAVLTHIGIDGGLITKILLVIGLTLIGMACTQLAQHYSISEQASITAGIFAIINTAIIERIFQGQWSLIVGIGFGFWATTKLIEDKPMHAAFAIIASGITVSSFLITLIVLAWIVLTDHKPSARTWKIIIPSIIIATLPWLIAGLINPDQNLVNAASVGVFTQNGFLKTLGLDGIWNINSTPDWHRTWFGVILDLITFAIAVVGIIKLSKVNQKFSRKHLIYVLVLIGIVAFSATSIGISILGQIVQNVPGTGVFRDTNKFLLAAIPIYSLGFAALTQYFGRYIKHQPLGTVIVIVLILVLNFDGLLAGWGKIQNISYPKDFQTVTDTINKNPGTTLSLPEGMLRKYWFDPASTQLDPIPRMIKANTIQDQTLTIDNTPIDQARNNATKITNQALDAKNISELSKTPINWLIVENSPGKWRHLPSYINQIPTCSNTETPVCQIFKGTTLNLYQFNHSDSIQNSPKWKAWLLNIVNTYWLLTLVFALIVALNQNRRRFRVRDIQN